MRRMDWLQNVSHTLEWESFGVGLGLGISWLTIDIPTGKTHDSGITIEAKSQCKWSKKEKGIFTNVQGNPDKNKEFRRGDSKQCKETGPQNVERWASHGCQDPTPCVGRSEARYLPSKTGNRTLAPSVPEKADSWKWHLKLRLELSMCVYWQRSLGAKGF